MLEVNRLGLRTLRLLAIIVILVLPLPVLIYKSCHHDGFNTCSANDWYNYKHSLTILSPALVPQFYERSMSNTSVNLVMATVKGDSIAWLDNVHRTRELTSQYSSDSAQYQRPWRIAKYVADDQGAPFHPAANKGREATMFFTYIVDHYDILPDFSIFIHAHEAPWHTEQALLHSMTETLNLLDLNEVARRGYTSLRTGHHNACPDWVRTDLAEEEIEKREEPFMYRSFVENFSPTNSSSDIEVPKAFGAPCCSQFAVPRATILKRPKSDYERMLHNLLHTELTDYIYGRTWEHMWQYLFLGKAVDCPVEWKVYCTLYHVCFPDASELQHYRELHWEQDNLAAELGLWKDLRHPSEAREKRKKIEWMRNRSWEMRDDALRRGLDPTNRKAVGDVYED